MEEKKCQRVARWLLPSWVTDPWERKRHYSGTCGGGLISQGSCFVEHRAWQQSPGWWCFFSWWIKAQAVFRNARSLDFSCGSLKAFLFSPSVSSSMLLVKLWMKGLGHFNSNVFILQLKLSIFLSGWLGKENSVVLCWLKAREEYPLAEGSYSRIVDTLPFLRIQISDNRSARLLAEMHLITIAVDAIKFDHVICSSVCKMPINRATP